MENIISTDGIYCLKCRMHTGNVELHVGDIMVKGRKRSMEKAICEVCGKKKNRFIKSSSVVVENI